ncbi:hypothetical protein CDL15_Pgr003918 [Punica granatum]|uniref:Uncharacterized protein n=1 Tax=Punica granatum TaxID=22663 RepID=A0A218X689_PUNGR|nr:hypothetical protein CDL15_Pgr003918 [Punica granatum]
MLFSFGSPGRPVESFYFGDANEAPAFIGLDARPPGLLLALHGHIERSQRCQAALSVVRRDSELRTLLIRVS